MERLEITIFFTLTPLFLPSLPCLLTRAQGHTKVRVMAASYVKETHPRVLLGVLITQVAQGPPGRTGDTRGLGEERGKGNG